MDSSASNAVANNKDVPSSMTPTAVEDDGAMSVNSGLAKEAALFFQSGNYADCVRVLYQLLQKKEGDPKVLHNIAIAVNFQDGCSNPKKLIDELNNAKNVLGRKYVHKGSHRVELSIGTTSPPLVTHSCTWLDENCTEKRFPAGSVGSLPYYNGTNYYSF